MKPKQTWDYNDTKGLGLFIVFNTLACRYRKCVGCILPSVVSSKYISDTDINSEIDYVFNVLLKEKQYKQITISNNGSVFDSDTFPKSSLIYLITKIINKNDKLDRVTIESRLEYMDIDFIEDISNTLRFISNTDLEISIGVEAFNANIRNNKLKKNVDFKSLFVTMFKLNAINVNVKLYMMFKPIVMTNDDAILDIQETINCYTLMIKKYNFEKDITLHINPTYIAKGTKMHKAFIQNTYTPPTMMNLTKSILSAEDSNILIYLGLYDEGLAVDNGSFINTNEDKNIIKTLNKFNINQDYTKLKEITC